MIQVKGFTIYPHTLTHFKNRPGYKLVLKYNVFNRNTYSVHYTDGTQDSVMGYSSRKQPALEFINQVKSEYNITETFMKKSDKIIAENAFKSMMREDKSSYYQNELNKIDINSEYHPNCKIIGGDGSSTKNFNINLDSIPIIIAWLKKVQVAQSKRKP